jgi:polyphenol oxidase
MDRMCGVQTDLPSVPWIWRDRRGPVQVAFTGRGPAGARDEALRAVDPAAPGVAWAKQIHSARVLSAAEPGLQGEGDALVTRRPDLALCVVTADCVPVLLAGPGGLAAVHAGWRGIAGGVILKTLETLPGSPGDWTAWMGPAIGACCYEVGPEVAAQVAAASDPAVVLAGPAGKPHLDLHEAVRRQLAKAGIGEVVSVPRCTRCATDRLWSYRREGKGAGRNHAFVWTG